MYKNYWPSVLALAFLLQHQMLSFDQKNGIFDTSEQLVVVICPNNNQVDAQLFKFEKTDNNWQQIGASHPVNLGKKGLAWGRGLNSPKPGLQKKEGDQRSPAGIFRFGTAFGYAAEGAVSLKLPYIPITETQICVEDSDSRYYNQLVDATQVQPDWKARETMLRSDEQYKWGIFVKQNVPAEPKGGSCIFFHLWRAPGSGTLGCTAMAEADLLQLMQWLDPKKKPLLMQMTGANYRDYQQKFSLPVLKI